jgi:hypothetical protein
MLLGMLRDEVANGVVLLLDDKVGAVGDGYDNGYSSEPENLSEEAEHIHVNGTSSIFFSSSPRVKSSNL